MVAKSDLLGTVSYKSNVSHVQNNDYQSTLFHNLCLKLQAPRSIFIFYFFPITALSNFSQIKNKTNNKSQ